MATAALERRVGYREVLAVREFRALFLAQLLSLLGDRAAAVALAVLVYERSQSPLLSATVFGLTFLPHLFAAPLAVLVDRLSRRRVLVLCDLARVPLVLAMVIPDMPLPVLFVLLGLVTLHEVPFDAANAVVRRAVLDDDQYPVGNALSLSLYEASLLLGSIGGGLLVAIVSVRGCLLINAATFLVSALILLTRLQPHSPNPGTDHTERSGLRDTLCLLLAPGPRRLLLLALLVAGAMTGAEGLAVTVAHELGGAAVLTGVLAAAIPAGALLAGLLVPRLFTRSQQQRLVVPLAVISLVALLMCGLGGGVVVTVVLWVVVGMGTGVLVIANPVVMSAVPDSHRGRAFGIASTGLMAAQGVGILVAGLLAGRTSSTTALAVMGLAGLVALVPLAPREPVVEGVAVDARTQVLTLQS